jgi:hypothetical protein
MSISEYDWSQSRRRTMRRSRGDGSSNAEMLAQGLGWFSIALGAAELMATEQMARALGMRGKENLIRIFGVREIGAGILTLSVDKNVGLWSRVAGDALDLAALGMEMGRNNRKRGNLMIALGMVAGVTLLDIAAAQATSGGRRGRRRQSGMSRDAYRGMDGQRGEESEFEQTPVMYWENEEETTEFVR